MADEPCYSNREPADFNVAVGLAVCAAAIVAYSPQVL